MRSITIYIIMCLLLTNASAKESNSGVSTHQRSAFVELKAKLKRVMKDVREQKIFRKPMRAIRNALDWDTVGDVFGILILATPIIWIYKWWGVVFIILAALMLLFVAAFLAGMAGSSLW